jgi:hypothetical protein
MWLFNSRGTMRSRPWKFSILSTGMAFLTACGGSDGPTGLSGPPVVTAVNGATLPASPVGSTVIIEGSNFGATQGAGQVLFSNGTGGTIPATIASASNWSDTFIVTSVPSGAATGDLIVETSGGSSTPVVFTITQNAPFSPSTVAWTSTSQLPVGLSGHAAAFAEFRGTTTARVIYAIGGEDNTNTLQTAVYYATVGGSGSLSGWTATTPLPTAVAFHRAVVATPANSKVSGPGFVYVLGGASNATGTQVAATIYRGTLAADGTVSGWTQSGSLPTPLHSFGATIFLGNVYIWGGATTNNAPVATVYRAVIDASGSLGDWQAQAALPSARAYFGYGSLGGNLYAFGGNTGTISPNEASVNSATSTSSISYAQIDLSSRNITSAGWTLNPSSLTKAVMKHTSVVAGGNVLVTAGLYAGATTGSSEELYAQLNADGSTSSFNGATGSNTISSAGGGNLFNHAAIGYVDGNGAFHVAVIGGDDVNTPGAKHKTVFFY